jgi:hypothetical protein
MSDLDNNTKLLCSLNALFNYGHHKKQKIFIKYCFDPLSDECYLLISNPLTKVILYDIDDRPVDYSKLTTLKREHEMLYVDVIGADKSKYDIWQRIMAIFIEPVLNILSQDFTGYIFVIFENAINSLSKNDTPFINIPYVYDLAFIHCDKSNICDIFFINVSDPEPIRFVTKLFKTSLPTAADIDILYGFPQNDATPEGQFRDQAFQDGMQKAKSQGANIFVLENIKIFEKLFSLTNNGRVIQMLTHFHNGRIHTPGLSNYIRSNDLISLLERMFLEDSLRNDISIHAATCTNFSSFKSLYESGIKNIYYSSNNLSTNEIAAMFWELYNGHNAAKIGCNFPYLDGKSFIFEAWTKVSRCFYRNAFLKNKIEICN